MRDGPHCTLICTYFRYTTDLALLQHKLKMQYGALMAGVVFGFLIGGFIYQAYKIDGVAIFGSIVMSIQVPNARTPHRLVLGVQIH